MDGPTASGYSEALALLDRRIELEILRLRARYQLSLDEFQGLYVSDQQVDRLVAAQTCPPHAAGDHAAPIAAPLRLDTRWNRLVGVFGLSALDEDVLLLALAPELDLKYEALYAYLNNDVTRKWPTLELARRLLAAQAPSPTTIAEALAPESPLKRQGLIETIEPPDAHPGQLNAGFALAPAVARFLTGVALTPASAHASVADPACCWRELPFAPPFIERLQGVARLLASRDEESPVIALIGERGSGREQAAHVIARELALPLRRFNFRDLRHAGTAPHTALRALALELRLEPAALCLSGFDALCDHEGHLKAEIRDVMRALDETQVPLMLLVSTTLPWRGTLGKRRALPIEFTAPDFVQRLRLWRRSLCDAGIDIDDDGCAALADRFRLASAQIRDAVRTARDWMRLAEGHGAIDVSLLLAAARAQSNAGLGGLASKVETLAHWDDLVLPPATCQRLREFSAAIQHRHVVYTDWGFAQRVACSHGIKALFAGASGTGKTMAAGVIARELGLDLYKIDLAGVVSKYIGETEKNLDRIFEAAHRANAVLFFDEADAVFGKRSEVKDAHDRYANVEVAYLLQKLEEHDGIVILASNLKRNLDEAFARRLHYVVDFPKPDAGERERLWRGMFPQTAPLDDDVDFAFLARQFELAGGDIRNVALDAAFLAACTRQAIGMRHLVQALARQLAKQGKSPSPNDFGRFFPLLHATCATRPPPA